MAQRDFLHERLTAMNDFQELQDYMSINGSMAVKMKMAQRELRANGQLT